MPTEERNLVKVACDACGAKYSLPEERLKGRVLKIRCKACSQVFEVRDDGSAPSPTSPLASRGQKRWFAVIDRQRVGPMTEQDLRDRHGRREITLRSYVWRQGMGEWKRLFEVEDFSDLEEHEVESKAAPRSATMKLVRLGAGPSDGRPASKTPSGATIGGAAATVSKVEGLTPEATRVVAYLPTKEQGDDRVRAVYVRGEEDTIPAPTALSGPAAALAEQADKSEVGLAGQATVEYPEHFARAVEPAIGEGKGPSAVEDDDEGPTTRLDVDDAVRLRAAIEAARKAPPRDPAESRQAADATDDEAQLAEQLVDAAKAAPTADAPDNATSQSLAALAEAEGEKGPADEPKETAGEEAPALQVPTTSEQEPELPKEPSVEVAEPEDLFGSSPAVDEAPAAPSGKGPVRLAGQRAEDSVLFSLDNLSRDQRHRLTGTDAEEAPEADDEEAVAPAVDAPRFDDPHAARGAGAQRRRRAALRRGRRARGAAAGRDLLFRQSDGLQAVLQRQQPRRRKWPW